jgi:Uma2 family endonuclease
MKPVTTSPTPADLDQRWQRIEELVRRHQASGCEDVEALIELTELLPEADGVPLETAWHRDQIHLFIDSLTRHWRGRDDFFVGGNMFLYYSLRRLRNQDFRGPDFFFVDGIDRHRRRDKWAVWEEDGRYPDLIVELLSPSTATTDRTVKKELYEKTFHTGEYYCYDPETGELEGWRLGPARTYRPVETDPRGWMWSEQLQLWLGKWSGLYMVLDDVWLRFFDRDGNLILTHGEAAQQQADAALQGVDAERQRAEGERQRAEILGQENQQLRAEIEELKRRLASGGS